ncbi:MAG: hypothetical protein K6E30_02480 [Lachnospiraceae bacterium]|nr:hypothetical protein [Lachnospiraceae bacterium]
MKRILTLLALGAILVCGIYAVSYAFENIPDAYDEHLDVVALEENPTEYDVTGADGVADIIVAQNLERTGAENNVAAVVFDFRGFDTLGESFILITSVVGSFVILSKVKKEEKEDAA